SQEDYFRAGKHLPEATSHFKSAQVGKPDIQQNQIRLQFESSCDCFSSVCGFPNDLQSRRFFYLGQHKMSPGPIVINNENANDADGDRRWRRLTIRRVPHTYLWVRSNLWSIKQRFAEQKPPGRSS